MELGYLAVFSEWGGQETVRAGLSFSLHVFLTKHNPANPQTPLKLDSIVSLVAGEVSRQGLLLDLHNECPVSCCLQHCPHLLQCLYIWVPFSLICSCVPEVCVCSVT